MNAIVAAFDWFATTFPTLSMAIGLFLFPLLPLIIAVAMYVYWERKVIGWMHVRMGPNKVGPLGLLQTFADVFKLLLKEVIYPTNANRTLFLLAPLWALLETALLTPDRPETTMSARGLALRYADGTVWVQSPAQWLAAHDGDAAQRAHDFAGIVFELRQYAALLEAHQLPLRLQSDAPAAAMDGYLLEQLAAASESSPAPRLFAHEAPGLGVVAISVAQPQPGSAPRMLAHGYPLQPQALGPLLQQLAAQYGTAAELDTRGQVVLDAAGALGAP